MGISCPWLIVVWVAYPFQSLSLTWTYLCLFVFALLTRGTSAIWRRWRKACRCITPSPSSLRFPSSKTPYRTYVRTFFFFFPLAFPTSSAFKPFFKYDVFLICETARRYPVSLSLYENAARRRRRLTSFVSPFVWKSLGGGGDCWEFHLWGDFLPMRRGLISAGEPLFEYKASRRSEPGR